MNELLLIILISFVVFISGCTQTQLSLNQTLSSIGQVNSFLSQYPNSTIQSVLLSTPPQNLVNQLCQTNLTLSNVYFVNITNQQQNLLLLLNATNNQMQCVTVTTAPALQQPANGTANVQLMASSGQAIGSVSVGNIILPFQFNTPSNLTQSVALSVPTNFTNPTSVSTGLNGTNLTIILQQGNLVQTIPINIQVASPNPLQQNQIPLTAPISATSSLKSNYFGNDQIALDIEKGVAVNYSFSGLYPAGAQFNINLDTDKFQYKILSALRMLGYALKPTQKQPLYLTRWSESFQKTHNLPVIDNITSDFILALDKDIYDLEQKIQSYVNSFPIPVGNYSVDISTSNSVERYDVTFVPNHKNEPPADYVRFFHSYLMSTLPKNIAPLTRESVHVWFTGQSHGVVYNDGWWKLNYIPSAQPLNRHGIAGIFRATRDGVSYPSQDFYHEYGHQIDNSLYEHLFPHAGMVNTTGFYELIFDIKNCSLNSAGRKTCAVRPNVKVVSDYSLSWENPNNPGHYLVVEAFAEAFAMYIGQGNVYRELSNIDSSYKDQYQWLKANVFGGVEYCTGDVNLITYVSRWDYRKNILPDLVASLTVELINKKVNDTQPIFSIFDEVVQCPSNVVTPPPGGSVSQTNQTPSINQTVAGNVTQPINQTTTASNITSSTNYTTNITQPSNATIQTNQTSTTNQTISGNQTSCLVGWICTGTFTRAYQSSNCSLGSTQYCNITCSNGVC